MKDQNHGFLASRWFFSQLVSGLKQSIWGYNVLLPNLRDSWFWPLGWVSHGESTNMYGYTLDMIYGESQLKDIK